MPAALDFWFDFSSPYGFFMSEKIDTLAARHGRTVRWRPFLLGAVYKLLGTQPLVDVPLKGAYSLRDFDRSARFLGIESRLPTPFPVATQHAARAFYWLDDLDPALARRFAQACYRAYFQAGHNIGDKVQVLDLAATLGADAEALADALEGDAAKTRLKHECAAAVDAGVFGSPYVIIDGEPFWGVDRLPQIERWLAEGGF